MKKWNQQAKLCPSGGRCQLAVDIRGTIASRSYLQVQKLISPSFKSARICANLRPDCVLGNAHKIMGLYSKQSMPGEDGELNSDTTKIYKFLCSSHALKNGLTNRYSHRTPAKLGFLYDLSETKRIHLHSPLYNLALYTYALRYLYNAYVYNVKIK